MSAGDDDKKANKPVTVKIKPDIIESSMKNLIMGLYDEQVGRLTAHPENGAVASINNYHKQILIQKLKDLEIDGELTTKAKNDAIAVCNQDIEKDKKDYFDQLSIERTAIANNIDQALNTIPHQDPKARAKQLTDIFINCYHYFVESSTEIADPDIGDSTAIGGTGAGTNSYTPNATIAKWRHAARLQDQAAFEYLNNIEKLKIKRRKDAALTEELNRIAQETVRRIQAKELGEQVVYWGRLTQAHPFSAFAGTTMAGSFILIGIDYAVKEKALNPDNPDDLTSITDMDMLMGFTFAAVPLFLIVWMANYYITKNIIGTLLYNFFIKGEWKPKSAKEWCSFIFSLVATFVSCIFTYFTTYTFVYELAIACSDAGSIAAWAEMLMMVFGIIAGVFTFITYFAVMHIYGKSLSVDTLKNNLNEVGDLAMIADLPLMGWMKFFLTRIAFKLIIAILLITLSASPLGWILLSMSAVYMVLTFALQYYSKHNARVAAQLQIALLVVYCLLSMTFLMYAAVDVLAMIYSFAGEHGSLVLSAITMFISWLGVLGFYTISTVDSVLHWMRKQASATVKEADVGTELKLLKEKNTQTDKTRTSVSKSPEEPSLAEQYAWVMILGNGVSNGLPNFYGALEFADTYGFDQAETYGMAIAVLLYSSTVSMAGNHKGIQGDLSYADEIARLRGLLGVIHSTQQFLDSAGIAKEMVQRYLGGLAVENTPELNAQKSACKKIIKLLDDYSALATDGADLTAIKASIKGFALDQAETKALQKGELYVIYEACVRPFVEIARADDTVKQFKAEVLSLLEQVKKYKELREGRSRFTFYFFNKVGCGIEAKLVPGLSKEQKIAAADKLITQLEAVLDIIDPAKAKTAEKPAPVVLNVDDEKALTNGHLGTYYAKAQKFLALNHFKVESAPVMVNN